MRHAQHKNIRWKSDPLTNILDPVAKLNEQAREEGYEYLLAFAADGVIWGRVEQSQIRLSGDVFPQISPSLDSATLQEARLFGPAKELYLWRDSSSGHGFRGRVIEETGDQGGPAYDEQWILWGSGLESQDPDSKFSLVSEGLLGIRQVLPLLVNSEALSKRRLRLRVRHYLTFDEAGAAYAAATRLFALEGNS